MKKSLRERLSTALCFWLLLAGAAFGGSQHTVPWFTYETAHFEIVFHSDVKPQADLARSFLEEAYAKISADLGMRERGIRITVVLTGLPDESNGFSTPLGHVIQIFTRPAQVIGASDIAWMKRVLAHELAHQITFLALRKSFWGIYSEVYKTGHLPAWFLEAIAQYEAESWDAKRNTFFAYALYNSALEPYPNLSTYVRQDPVSGRLVYEQGHAFLRFLRSRLGQGFLGPLLKEICVIPLWTEFKELLSPLTAAYLPLEDAIEEKSGKSVRALYEEFLDSMNVGLSAAPPPAKPMLGGVPGFSAVFNMKIVDSSTFVFTAQRDWDQSYTSLFISRKGRVEKIGPDFVNPVIDLSPDKAHILYVRTYTRPDDDPVDKLFISDLSGGSVRFISDGAANPIFLSRDSIAFSHYRSGKQALALCSVAGPDATCAEAVSDSLVGFYALSRSATGILCNATDTAGRTGVYEYRLGVGIHRLVRDTVTAEFPVEAQDGSVLMLHDRGGLLQVDDWSRETGRFTPAATYPLGTFYLHRADSAKAVSIVQTGSQGQWRLMPVEVPAVKRDTSASSSTSRDTTLASGSDTSGAKAAAPSMPLRDSIATYKTPGFLYQPKPDFADSAVVQRNVRVTSPQSYLSLLEIKPILLWPGIYDDFPGTGPGGSIFLEDPLQFHSASIDIAKLPSGIGYAVTYVNRQSPVDVIVTASNLSQTVDPMTPPVGWKEVDLVERFSHYGLAVNIPAPFDIPLPHAFTLGLKAQLTSADYRLAGQRDSGSLEAFDFWKLNRESFLPQIFLAYFYQLPYAYEFAHPLVLTDLEVGYSRSYPDDGDIAYWYARETFPLWRELTVTARYQAQRNQLPFQQYTAILPDGTPRAFYLDRRQGYTQEGYASLDFPIHKGYLMELPVFGLWNYLGGSFFGGFTREDYKESTGAPGSGIHTLDGAAGAKLDFLFHILRRAPLVLSQSMQYDYGKHEIVYRTQVEFAGVPTSVSLSPEHPEMRRGRLP